MHLNCIDKQSEKNRIIVFAVAQSSRVKEKALIAFMKIKHYVAKLLVSRLFAVASNQNYSMFSVGLNLSLKKPTAHFMESRSGAPNSVVDCNKTVV